MYETLMDLIVRRHGERIRREFEPKGEIPGLIGVVLQARADGIQVVYQFNSAAKENGVLLQGPLVPANKAKIQWDPFLDLTRGVIQEEVVGSLTWLGATPVPERFGEQTLADAGVRPEQLPTLCEELQLRFHPPLGEALELGWTVDRVVGTLLLFSGQEAGRPLCTRCTGQSRAADVYLGPGDAYCSECLHGLVHLRIYQVPRDVQATLMDAMTPEDWWEGRLPAGAYLLVFEDFVPPEVLEAPSSQFRRNTGGYLDRREAEFGSVRMHSLSVGDVVETVAGSVSRLERTQSYVDITEAWRATRLPACSSGLIEEKREGPLERTIREDDGYKTEVSLDIIEHVVYLAYGVSESDDGAGGSLRWDYLTPEYARQAYQAGSRLLRGAKSDDLVDRIAHTLTGYLELGALEVLADLMASRKLPAEVRDSGGGILGVHVKLATQPLPGCEGEPYLWIVTDEDGGQGFTCLHYEGVSLDVEEDTRHQVAPELVVEWAESIWQRYEEKSYLFPFELRYGPTKVKHEALGFSPGVRYTEAEIKRWLGGIYPEVSRYPAVFHYEAGTNTLLVHLKDGPTNKESRS